nr:HAD family phosphatase [uncultured Cellulosilyticum sp.]
MIEAVLFDLDGTLIHSSWVWPQVTVAYLGQYGLKVPDNLDELEGKSFTEIAKCFKERFHLPQTVEEIKATWNAMGEALYTKQVRLKEDVLAFLEMLSKAHIKIGVATSNSIEMTEKALLHLGIRSYFDVICTSCMVEVGKPNPAIYLETARRLGMNPKNCLVLEDMPNGVKAGKAAGMTVWAIQDSTKEETINKLKVLADAYFEDYKSVRRVFEKSIAF